MIKTAPARKNVMLFLMIVLIPYPKGLRFELFKELLSSALLLVQDGPSSAQIL
jgi:hypothetical protein